MELSAYQAMRKANLGENSALLAKHGLLPPVVEHTALLQKSPVKRIKPVKRWSKPIVAAESREPQKFSLRIRMKPPTIQDDALADFFDSASENDDSDSDYEVERKVKIKKLNDIPEVLQKYLRKPLKPLIQRPNTYGSIKGVRVGDWWEMRLDCSYDGIHRPTVAGIHPGPEGAYSVALSGGYEDDRDLGDSFTYTGEGGRDLKGTKTNPKNLRTAPQSKDQTLTRGNLALSLNAELGTPVRVIRGYKLSSPFAPEMGYRYDGLYKVSKYWPAVGESGFKVYKFLFERCDTEPAPWHENFDKTPAHQESDETTEEPWYGWPPQVNVPQNNIFHIECEGRVERVQLIGDDIIVLTNDQNARTPSPLEHQNREVENNIIALSDDQNPSTPSPLENQNPEVPENLEDGWCGWPPQVGVSGNVILHMVCDGVVERVKLIGDEWEFLSKTSKEAPEDSSCQDLESEQKEE